MRRGELRKVREIKRREMRRRVTWRDVFEIIVGELRGLGV